MNTKTTRGLITVASALALAVGLTTISVQQVFAPTCSSCAKSFAPGQLALNAGFIGSDRVVPPGPPSHNFGPGHQVPPGPDGHSDFAPGIEKQVQTGPGP
jgi:hypothetical protein